MISVLLATTGRAEQAAACASSVFLTTEDYDVEVVAAVDNDLDTAEALTALGCVVDHSINYRGCSRAWNDALALCGGDPVVLAADDLDFQTGWLDAALEQLLRFPDEWGMVGFNDGHLNHGLSTHYLMSRRFVIEVLGGVIAWECYRHSFNDVEVNERARAAGRYSWAEGAHVLHSHWTYGDRAQDDTDARWLGEHSASEAAYNARHAAGFPSDYAPVITH